MISSPIALQRDSPGAASRQSLKIWTLRALSRAASAHLDLIRAVAASAVMWGHVRALFFVDFQHLQRPGWFLGIVYFLTGFGHQAVMVFFVLSRFLISSTVIKSHLSGRWSWRDYAINRTTRLYVVLIPGLLFGLLWDFAGSSLLASKGLYTHPLIDLGTAIPVENLTIGNFFGNLFYLQTILCATFGSNGPLWSLANEFWYYVLFPLGLSAGIAWRKRSSGSAVLSAVLTILAMAVCVFIGRGILLGFLIWLAGCALVLAYGKFQLRSKVWLIFWLVLSFLALSGTLAAVRIGKLADVESDLVVGLTFTLFLFFALQVRWGAANVVYDKLSRLFAGFSYSLYVLHFPFLLFLRARVTPGNRWVPDARHLIYGFLIGATALSFAWLVSVFTENKTSIVRKWVARVIGNKVAS
jgi:peptidoglycan/LPS O-acetylase OafA/YrhL